MHKDFYCFRLLHFRLLQEGHLLSRKQRKLIIEKEHTVSGKFVKCPYTSFIIYCAFIFLYGHLKVYVSAGVFHLSAATCFIWKFVRR